MRNENIQLERLVVEKGKLSELNIKFENHEKYLVQFNSQEIIIESNQYNYYPGGKYNNLTQEITWFLRHCCGASGFNPLLGDDCLSCRLDGKTNDKKIGEIYGNKNLVEIIEYFQNVEEKTKHLINENGLK